MRSALRLPDSDARRLDAVCDARHSERFRRNIAEALERAAPAVDLNCNR